MRPLAASTAADLARAHGGNVTFVYQHALKGFAARLSPVRAEALASDPRVAYVEPDQLVDALATQSPATWGLDRTETVRLQFRATTDAILPTSFRILDRLRPPFRRGAQHSGPPARNAGHVATTSP